MCMYMYICMHTTQMLIMTCMISGMIFEFIFLPDAGGLGSALIPFESSSSCQPGLPHAAHLEGRPHGPWGHKFGVALRPWGKGLPFVPPHPLAGLPGTTVNLTHF